MWQNVAALNLLEVGQNTFSLSDKKSSNNKTKQNKKSIRRAFVG